MNRRKDLALTLDGLAIGLALGAGSLRHQRE